MRRLGRLLFTAAAIPISLSSGCLLLACCCCFAPGRKPDAKSDTDAKPFVPAAPIAAAPQPQPKPPALPADSEVKLAKPMERPERTAEEPLVKSAVKDPPPPELWELAVEKGRSAPARTEAKLGREAWPADNQLGYDAFSFFVEMYGAPDKITDVTPAKNLFYLAENVRVILRPTPSDKRSNVRDEWMLYAFADPRTNYGISIEQATARLWWRMRYSLDAPASVEPEPEAKPPATGIAAGSHVDLNRGAFGGKNVFVHSYTRKDGTVVKGHYRSR